MLQNYPQEVLDAFLGAIQGEGKAFDALMTTLKCPELAALSNGINDDVEAQMWLKVRVGMDWWLLCMAINYDESAIKKLQEKKGKFDISFVLACHNRIEGKYWLAQHGYSHFLPICEAIIETMKKRGWEQMLYKTFS